MQINYGCISVFTANMLCLLAGSTSTWTSPELPKLHDANVSTIGRSITTDEHTWIACFNPIGAMMAPIIFGILMDLIGRKWSLIICGIIMVTSYAMLAFGRDLVFIYIGRVFSGIAAGGVYVVVPLYFGEIAETSSRGAVGASLAAAIGGGQLFSYLVGPYVTILILNLILSILSVLYLLLFLILGVESPYYLMKKNEPTLAKAALLKLRSNDDQSSSRELLEIQTFIEGTIASKGTFLDIFKFKGLIRALFTILFLNVVQQCSGINAFMFYAQTIFKDVGSSLDSAVSSIILGFVNVGANLISPVFSDRLGRKILLILSSIGMTVAEAPLIVYGYYHDQGTDLSSVSFIPLICLILYLFSFNAATSSIPYVLLGEMFPAHVKSIASSISFEVTALTGFVVIRYFPVFSESLGMGSCYLIFTCFSAASIPFCIFCLFETKGKTFEEIQDILNNKK